MDLFRRNDASVFSIYGIFTEKFPYSILFPYIYGSHDNSYRLLPFSINIKIKNLIPLVCSVHSSIKNCDPENMIVPITLTFQKNESWEICIETCFQLIKKNEWGYTLKKPCKSILLRKTERGIQKVEKNCYSRCWKLGLVPIYEAKSGKQSILARRLSV